MIRKILKWSGLAVPAILAAACIFGALLSIPALRQAMGINSAPEFFNSAPLAIFWIALAAVSLAASIKNTIEKKWGLAVMHLAMAAIIAGGMLSSKAGLEIRNYFAGDDKPQKGFMLLARGETENKLYDECGKVVGKLNFHVRLENFAVEYYPPGDTATDFHIAVMTSGDENSPVKERFNVHNSQTAKIPLTDIQMQMIGWRHEPDKSILTLQFNRGYKIFSRQITFDTLQAESFYELVPLVGVFDDAQQWASAGWPTLFVPQPQRQVRSYQADLALLKDSRHVAGGRVSINHPLHYGGYHFYLHDYDRQNLQDVIISAVTNDGLYVAYVGFTMLVAGAVGHFWLGPVFRAIRKEHGNGD